MIKKFSLSQDVFYASDILIKLIGIGALVVSAVFAYIQYRDFQEREYKKAFYEKQLGAVDEIFSIFTEIDTALTESEKQRAVKKFWMIYHGSGQVYLSPELYESLNKGPVSYLKSCIAKITPPIPSGFCKETTASQSVFGFAKVARKQLSTTWNLGFTEISATDPMVPRKWQKSN